jgi:N-acetylglucosaminyldiphosphoundecaprenol N-acetyl-beta-D-mannosaminyltransferase
MEIMSIEESLKNRQDTLTIEEELPVQQVIGFPVTALSLGSQMSTILRWGKRHLSKVVCIANVHMLVEGYQNQQFASILKRADLVAPDGMPLVWMLKHLGAVSQDRVAGLDVLESLCELAPQQGVSIFFLGSHRTILEKMRIRLNQDYPTLDIAGMEPLPFRPMSAEEDEAIIQLLNDSGAGIVLVSLGCPKQELWMANHKDKVNAVMIGLGGAFPVYAGIHKRAPAWIRGAGLEWLYRLAQEPRRLWKRYASTIPVFLWLAGKQLLMARRAS